MGLWPSVRGCAVKQLGCTGAGSCLALGSLRDAEGGCSCWTSAATHLYRAGGWKSLGQGCLGARCWLARLPELKRATSSPARAKFVFLRAPRPPGRRPAEAPQGGQQSSPLRKGPDHLFTGGDKAVTTGTGQCNYTPGQSNYLPHTAGADATLRGRHGRARRVLSSIRCRCIRTRVVQATLLRLWRAARLCHAAGKDRRRAVVISRGSCAVQP